MQFLPNFKLSILIGHAYMSRYVCMLIVFLLTWVASEYGVLELAGTSADPKTVGDLLVLILFS